MFKTKEELIKEANLDDVNEYTDGYNLGFDEGLCVAFESFAERVEFYKKYRELYYTPDEKIWEEYIEYHTKHLEVGWKDWLFDYCFGDIVKGD